MSHLSETTQQLWAASASAQQEHSPPSRFSQMRATPAPAHSCITHPAAPAAHASLTRGAVRPTRQPLFTSWPFTEIHPLTLKHFLMPYSKTKGRKRRKTSWRADPVAEMCAQPLLQTVLCALQRPPRHLVFSVPFFRAESLRPAQSCFLTDRS